MATKFYLRVGAWYKSETGKSLSSDIDITDIVNNTDPNNPFIEDDGSIGGANVQSIIAGTNITLGGSASNPVINSNGGSGTLQYVAFMTQQVSDDLTSGVLEIGKEYFISDYQTGDNFLNVGAASNATDVAFVATGTTPTVWSNGSTVTHSYDPVADVLINTIGTITWEFEGYPYPGFVTATSAGLFTLGKTFAYTNYNKPSTPTNFLSHKETDASGNPNSFLTVNEIKVIGAGFFVVPGNNVATAYLVTIEVYP